MRGWAQRNQDLWPIGMGFLLCTTPTHPTAPPHGRGCRTEKKKRKTRSVQYALRWRPVGNRWRLVGNRWRLVCNRWRLVGNRWRLVGNRWRLVGNRWQLVGSHQTSESGCHSKKKRGVSVLMAPPAPRRRSANCPNVTQFCSLSPPSARHLMQRLGWWARVHKMGLPIDFQFEQLAHWNFDAQRSCAPAYCLDSVWGVTALVNSCIVRRNISARCVLY